VRRTVRAREQDAVATERFAEQDGALKITKETGAFICRTS